MNPFFWLKNFFCCLVICLFFISGCKKDGKIIEDNNAPYYDKVPTLKVQNYVNRLFIDLIGREPLDLEMTAEVNYLQANNLNFASRELLINKLQTDTVYRSGDSSYKYAYYNRFYEMCKTKMLEENALKIDIQLQYGNYLSSAAAADSSGDSIGLAKYTNAAKKILAIIECEQKYRTDSIEIKDLFAIMIDNFMYDNTQKIAQNITNYIRTTFNDLFFRYPTASERSAGEIMVANEEPAILFNKSGQNRGDYVQLLVNSNEFYEGIIRWLYRTYVVRDPTSTETYTHMTTFFVDHDVQKLQKAIMKSDEYANF